MTRQNTAPFVAFVFAAMCAAPSFAMAQDAPPPATSDVPAAPADAPAPAPADAPAPLADSAPADGAGAPAPNLSDVSAKVDGLEEAFNGTKATVDGLSKLKISGYVQGRLELHEISKAGVDDAGKPLIFDRFYVRRGRLKALYSGTNAEYMLQIDATGDGVVLKDAEASIVDSWTPFNFKLTVGQFKVPFGYEVLQSSGDREMPERSLYIRSFFPNERDRGVRLNASRDWFRFSGAVVNGNFIQDSIYANTDPNGWKDVVARVGGDFDWFVFGISGSYGKALNTTLGKAAVIGGADANGDKVLTGNEISITPATPTTYTAYMRARVGVDVQTYFDVPGVGGLALKGETALSRDRNTGAPSSLPADPCKDVVALGWILTGIQNIGDHFGVVARVDQYRPNMAARTGCTASLTATPTSTKTTTLGLGLNLYVSSNVKLSVFGEKVTGRQDIAPTDRYDDRVTVQMQAKF
jgi:Phosphate-selective porin O and P